MLTSPKKGKMIGHSTKFQEVLRTAELVAMTDVPVLISGETGTGKKHLALNIHQQSTRKQRPFIRINCASLPEGRAEEIIFGRKQSMQAEEQVQGCFFRARSGTLLLENISKLSKALQIKLLHFIETGEIQAVDSIKWQVQDVRLIVTTQKNLLEEVKAGRFYADLYYRLNVIPVNLPCLKEREGDVNLLMDYFLRQLVSKQHQPMPSFTNAALKQINRYTWSGNVRELQNFCERMFILFSGKQVDITNLPEEIRLFSKAPFGDAASQPFSLPASGIKLDEVEVDLMRQALQNTNGNKSRAARLLGLTRDTFLYRLKKYSIDI